MKHAKFALLITLALFTTFANAADFKLTDPKILGEYKLVKQDKKSEIQTASLVYNTDNELVLMVDRNDQEYQLSGPDKNNLIVDFSDEPNCDGDEPSCLYDSSVQIQLTKNERGLPRLSIEITTTDAWIEDGSSDETSTYVLDWSNTLPDQIPFYTTTKNPVALQILEKDCKKVVQPAVGTGGLYSFTRVCPSAFTNKLRKPYDEAIQYFLKDQFSKAEIPAPLTSEQIQKMLFKKNEALIKKLDKKDLAVSISDLLAQAKKYQQYILNKGDQFYVEFSGSFAYLYAVNSKAKTITRYNFAIK